jgi:DNA primase
LETIEHCGLGVVPDREWSRRALEAAGYSQSEIDRSSVLADSRWGGRVCGAWRDESGRVKTLWARALDEDESPGSRYLYLRGASRTDLPPYGLSQVLKQPPSARRQLVLVEGLFDVHQLRSREVENVTALGGTGVRAPTFDRLARIGFESVTLCLDRDRPGRIATARAVEQAARAGRSPTIFVVDPEALAPAKDPDGFVRERGVAAWSSVVASRVCGIAWRAQELVAEVSPDSDLAERRAALAHVGAWLGTLPPRLALEQEDAVTAISGRCGYSEEAARRAFQARYWSHASPERGSDLAVGL